MEEIPHMDSLFHGKSQEEMDDEMKYPYDLGNLHVGMIRWMIAKSCTTKRMVETLKMMG